MGSVTIRNLADEVKRGARLAAVKNGRSMEAEIRLLLERTYGGGNDDRAARLRAMSGTEFVDHLIAITRPGIDDDPFAGERADKALGDVFGAD